MKLMFVGDINLGEYYTSFGHGPRSYLKNFNVFEKVAPIFESADFVIGNLEAVLSDLNVNLDDPASVVLRGSTKSAKILYDSGFRVLQVANNHTVQHGQECFNDMLLSLKAAGIDCIGLNKQELLIREMDGITVGFLAASDVPDNTNDGQEVYQKLDDGFIEKVRGAVNKVDHLFVLLHWGLEVSTVPMDYQLQLTNQFCDYGVRGVVGSHPHLFYEIWKKDNMIIAPSLGNFVFDLCWDKRYLDSGILETNIVNGEIRAKVWPVKLKRNGCLPSPAKISLAVDKKINLYDNGTSMDGAQIRKMKYFLRHILTGNTKLKLKFILTKFVEIFD
jgi:poly-gamma-glutamate synthesis protein (capsule biosynthesis protein)